MKQFWILFLAISMASMSVQPATANSNNERAMLFPQFENGAALLRSNNAVVSAQFNYDVVAERMLFYCLDGTLFEVEASGVVKVVAGGRVFVPRGRFFYERITVGDHAFYVRHRILRFGRAFTVGYNTYTNIQHTVGSIGGTQFGGATVSSEGRVTIMGVPQTHSYRDVSSVFIRSGRRYVQISSLQRLTNLFRPHRASIEAFAQENETDFRNVESIQVIVTYALSLL